MVICFEEKTLLIVRIQLTVNFVGRYRSVQASFVVLLGFEADGMVIEQTINCGVTP